VSASAGTQVIGTLLALPIVAAVKIVLEERRRTSIPAPQP
jgi:hypothetical protein